MANRPLPPTPLEISNRINKNLLNPQELDNRKTESKKQLFETRRESNKREKIQESASKRSSFIYSDKDSEDDLGLWAKVEYYSKDYSKSQLMSKLGRNINADKVALQQDDQGYLEPLPPPLPPRRKQSDTAEKWKCNCGSCFFCCGCLRPIYFMYKLFSKAFLRCEYFVIIMYLGLEL